MAAGPDAHDHGPHPPRRTRRAALLGAAGVVAAGVSVVVGRSALGGGDPEQVTPTAARRFRPTNLFVFGHSWAAGTNVRRSGAWPARLADALRLPRPVLFPSDETRRSDFAWGGSRAVGPAAEHGAGWVLRSLPKGPQNAPSLVLLLTGDNDISRHGQSAAARALLGGGIHAALGRLLATEVHEEDDPVAWSFSAGWKRDGGRELNSGSGVHYTLTDGATFTVRLPRTYAGTPVTVGLPLWDATVGGTIAWALDDEPLSRRTDLSALQRVLTKDDPSAVYAERFAGFPAGPHELRGTWSAGPERGSALVVDYWSTERRDARIVCALMPDANPWANTFGGVTTVSNRANREALKDYRRVTYVDLARAVLPTGTRSDRRYWDSDASSHPTRAGEIAIARTLERAIRRIAA